MLILLYFFGPRVLLDDGRLKKTVRNSSKPYLPCIYCSPANSVPPSAESSYISPLPLVVPFLPLLHNIPSTTIHLPLPIQYHTTTPGPTKMLPPRCHPRHRTDQHDHAHRRRGIVHILRVHRIDGREVEGNAREQKIHEADDIERDGEAAQAEGAVGEGAVRGRGEEGEEACEEGERVGDV